MLTTDLKKNNESELIGLRAKYDFELKNNAFLFAKSKNAEQQQIHLKNELQLIKKVILKLENILNDQKLNVLKIEQDVLQNTFDALNSEISQITVENHKFQS
ncbi:hypothetical protein M153_8960002041 [Pseudoloma neurophilia]|uniref:Uncharacterized protein n=1 Tax=Pseudoloma neurophilia TaxID=146866 RepID=A0A0R0LW43_9MICR|nr:hypothetical protein M153_8960002041 [Pseudoloma neurophilia]